MKGNELAFTASAFICQALNGALGVTVFSGTPLVTARWFANNERFTATSIVFVG